VRDPQTQYLRGPQGRELRTQINKCKPINAEIVRYDQLKNKSSWRVTYGNPCYTIGSKANSIYFLNDHSVDYEFYENYQTGQVGGYLSGKIYNATMSQIVVKSDNVRKGMLTFLTTYVIN
jgi:hypothetical protein